MNRTQDPPDGSLAGYRYSIPLQPAQGRPRHLLTVRPVAASYTESRSEFSPAATTYLQYGTHELLIADLR